MTNSRQMPVNRGEPMAAASGPDALVMRNQPLAFRDWAAAQASPQQSPKTLTPAEIEALAMDGGTDALENRRTQSANFIPPSPATDASAADDQGRPDQEPQQR